jgi:hypothetical protein
VAYPSIELLLPQMHNGGAPIRIITKRNHMFVPPQNGVYDFPLHSYPSSMNNAYLLEPFAHSLEQIFLHYVSYFPRLKGMQVNPIFNGDFHRF